MKKASIFWCTGMSGVGKSTLSEYAKSELENHGYNILILDGDVERENYDIKLGFGKNDVEKNNLNVAIQLHPTKIDDAVENEEAHFIIRLICNKNPQKERQCARYVHAPYIYNIPYIYNATGFIVILALKFPSMK